MSAVKYSKLDLNNFIYIKNKDNSKNKDNGKNKKTETLSYSIVYQTDDNIKDILIQIPKMRIPFGIRNTVEEYNKDLEDKYNIVFSLDTDEKYKNTFNKNNEINKFVEFLKKMDERNLEFLSKNSEEFFGKKRSVGEIMEFELYTSIVKVYKPKKGNEDKKFPPTFKCKVPVINGEAKINVFNGMDGSEYKPSVEHIDDSGNQVLNEKGEKMYKTNWEYFYNAFEGVALIHKGLLRIVNKKAYFNWKLKAVQMFKNTTVQTITINSFIQDEAEGGDEKAEGVEAEAEDDEGAEGEGSNEVLVSDDDD